MADNCLTCTHTLCASRVPIFSNLSQNELLEIVSMTNQMTYQKGDYLSVEGETSKTLFILNEGRVKLSKMTKEGKEQIVRLLSSGDFFGELNLFSEDETNNFTALALTPVKMCLLTKEQLDQIILKNPQIALKILKEVTKKMKDTENLVETLATNDAETRIAYMLMEFSDKYGEKDHNTVLIQSPLTREEMANFIGVTRETMSRKLSLFQDWGWIELIGNKQIRVLNSQAIKNYLE